ncbi:MAG: hypothetical protein FNT29_10830 [Halothiobacillaceae bacterium]|nr:MAG: hypothetical protein FNT29_10830 [Halothiobacillaceae bacterium]
MDKFSTCGLKTSPAAEVNAPLIDECHAQLECKVVDTRMVQRYNVFVLEVVKAWHDPAVSQPETLHHRGHGRFMVAGREVRLPSVMR